MSSEWACSFLGALLLAAIGWIDLSRLRKPILSAGSISITRLTHDGKSSAPAISRDGKYVAYLHQDGDLESIWVRQIATASDVQILSPRSAPTLVTFSADGNCLYFADSPMNDLAGKRAPRDV